MKIPILAVLVCVAVLLPGLLTAGPADSVYLNGRIYTASDRQPWAEAVAITDGKFVYVGDNETVLRHRGVSTVTTDLNRKMVMPGNRSGRNRCTEDGV
jgi:hypothetical protein